jgi:hypothetical protein
MYVRCLCYHGVTTGYRITREVVRAGMKETKRRQKRGRLRLESHGRGAGLITMRPHRICHPSTNSSHPIMSTHRGCAARKAQADVVFALTV